MKMGPSRIIFLKNYITEFLSKTYIIKANLNINDKKKCRKGNYDIRI